MTCTFLNETNSFRERTYTGSVLYSNIHLYLFSRTSEQKTYLYLAHIHTSFTLFRESKVMEGSEKEKNN